MQIASAQYYTEESNLRGLAADAVAKSASTKAEKSTASAKAEKVWVFDDLDRVVEFAMHILCPSSMNDILIIHHCNVLFQFPIIIDRADAKAEKHSKATKLFKEGVAKSSKAKSGKAKGEKMSMPHSAKSGKAKSVKAEKAVADAKAGKESSAKGEAKTAGPKGAADAKAGKEASAKGAEKTASEKAASPAKGEKAEKAASEKAAAKSDKASQGKYIHVCCVVDGCLRIDAFEVL